MKTINRAQLRGKPLDTICKSALTTRHEFGKDDNPVFCYGVYVLGPEFGHLHGNCYDCKAYVDNAEPPKEENT